MVSYTYPHLVVTETPKVTYTSISGSRGEKFEIEAVLHNSSTNKKYTAVMIQIHSML